MTNSARLKGRDFEALIRRWLTDQNISNMNPASVGRPGGDVLLTDHPIMIEAKCRKDLALSTWMRQAEKDAGKLLAVLVHKRKGVADPAGQWCSMELGTFVAILNQTGVERQKPPATPSGASGLADTTLDSTGTLTGDLEAILVHVEQAIKASKQARNRTIT